MSPSRQGQAPFRWLIGEVKRSRGHQVSLGRFQTELHEWPPATEGVLPWRRPEGTPYNHRVTALAQLRIAIKRRSLNCDPEWKRTRTHGRRCFRIRLVPPRHRRLPGGNQAAGHSQLVVQQPLSPQSRQPRWTLYRHLRQTVEVNREDMITQRQLIVCITWTCERTEYDMSFTGPSWVLKLRHNAREPASTMCMAP